MQKIKVGDLVKARVNRESFWNIVKEIKPDGTLVVVVDNDLLNQDNLKLGDEWQMHPSDVIDVWIDK